MTEEKHVKPCKGQATIRPSKAVSNYKRYTIKKPRSVSFEPHIQRRDMSVKDYLPPLYSYYQGFGNLVEKKQNKTTKLRIMLPKSGSKHMSTEI